MPTKFRYRSDTGFFPTLERAWRKLKTLKIYGKRNACCRTCSCYEAEQEMKAKGLDDYLGYVHYNVQSREGCQSSGKLYLGFSGEDETAQRAVANLAKLHFEAHGFNVEWNGSLGTCLLLTLKDAS
jgi:hypothetical protein